jgi:hypothetical protein
MYACGDPSLYENPNAGLKRKWRIEPDAGLKHERRIKILRYTKIRTRLKSKRRIETRRYKPGRTYGSFK